MIDPDYNSMDDYVDVESINRIPNASGSKARVRNKPLKLFNKIP